MEPLIITIGRQYGARGRDIGIALAKELQPFEEVIETDAGCTICSHCGPNCLGVLFLKK